MKQFAIRAASVCCLIATLVLQGCITVEPQVNAPSPTSNVFTVYDTPRFQSRVNWIGATLIAVTAAGGAGAGYASNVALPWNGSDRLKEVNPIGNAALGAIAGTALSTVLTLWIQGAPPRVDPTNVEEWLTLTNPELKFHSFDTLETGQISRINSLAPKAELKFRIASMKDVQGFVELFPNSPYTDSVMKAAIPKLPDTALPALVSYFPDKEFRYAAMERYVKNSMDFSTALQRAKKYPELADSAAERASRHATTIEQAKEFSIAFPSNPNLDSILQKITMSLYRSDIPKFLEAFPNSPWESSLRQQYVDKSASTADVIEAGERFPELASQAESKAADLANSPNEWRAYLSTWPTGKRATEMIARINQQLSKLEVLSSNVNSEYNEISPVISPDGKTLFFSRKYSPDNTGGMYDPDEIWYSVQKANGDWTVAKQIGDPLNLDGPDHMGSITPDGNTILLGRTYDGSTSGLSISHRTAKGWGYPEKLDIKGYYNLSDYISYYLANDGKTLLLAIQRRDSRGDLDLYVSFLRSDGTWSEPMNLGSTINTKKSDSSPFLASDGVTLYFSSSGHRGYGGSDIFMSRRLDDTWKKWSKPTNLGPTINSDYTDAYLFIPASGDYAYFASSRESVGDIDIVRIGVPESSRPRPVILVQGRVLEQGTDKPLFGTISYERLSDGKQIGTARSDPSTGSFKIALPSGELYGFHATVEGYIAVSDNLDLTKLRQYGESKRDLYMVPIKVGGTVRLNNLFFDFGKAILRKESYSELDRLSAILKEHSTMAIEIVGHTDNVGEVASNELLSQQRANAVAQYIVKAGIPQTRLSIKGLGESLPVATNDTEEGRQLNRRVEFTIQSE